VATDAKPLALVASVRPGLLTDAAIMEIQNDRIDKAAADLVKALDVVAVDASDGQPLAFARAAIAQATQWAAARIDGSTSPEDLSANPGVFSTLWPQFDSTQQVLPEPKPNRELYLLARLEIIADVDADVQTRLLERERVDGVQPLLATGLCAMRMDRYIARADATSVFALLPRHAWLCGLLARAAGTTHSVDDQISPTEWGDVESAAARLVVSGVIGMSIASDRLEEAVHVAEQAREMSHHLHAFLPETENGIIDPPEFPATGIAALRRLRADEQVNAEQLLRTSVELFMWLKPIGVAELISLAYPVLAARWLELTQRRRAILSTPRLSVPAIETAAAGTPDIGGMARLIEAGRLASSLRLPAYVVDALKAAQ